MVYGDPAVLPTPEPTANLPISPYGVSKLAGEHYLRVLGALHGFEGVALRYSNVYGPRQDPKSEAGVVSIFVSRLLDGQAAHRFLATARRRAITSLSRTSPAPTCSRPSVAVSRGDRLDVPAFNIATGRETSVNDLAQHVGRALGRAAGHRIRARPPRRTVPVVPRCLQGRHDSCDWTPQVAFDEGCKQLAALVRGSRRVIQDSAAVANTGFLHLVFDATIGDAGRAGDLRALFGCLMVRHRGQVVGVPPPRLARARAFFTPSNGPAAFDERQQAMAGLGESPYAEIVRAHGAAS